jgi:hypothetical protein
MVITDEARNVIEQMFKEENVKNIRIFFDGFG